MFSADRFKRSPWSSNMVLTGCINVVLFDDFLGSIFILFIRCTILYYIHFVRLLTMRMHILVFVFPLFICTQQLSDVYAHIIIRIFCNKKAAYLVHSWYLLFAWALECIIETNVFVTPRALFSHKSKHEQRVRTLFKGLLLLCFPKGNDYAF